jgi:hypothetical protein
MLISDNNVLIRVCCDWSLSFLEKCIHLNILNHGNFQSLNYLILKLSGIFCDASLELNPTRGVNITFTFSPDLYLTS